MDGVYGHGDGFWLRRFSEEKREGRAMFHKAAWGTIGQQTARKNGISRVLAGEIHGFFMRLNRVLRLTSWSPRPPAANLNVPFRYFL
jgi:hypothetical protein